MSTNTASPLLDAIIQGWQEYQKQLVTVVRAINPEQLVVRAAPDLRPVSEIVAHVIAARAFWFFEVLKEGNDDIAAMMQWDEQPSRMPAEYAYGLEATWTLMQDALARWTETQLAEPIVLPWIGPAHPITRSFVVWHVIEHDLHHGGEVTHTLGTQGLAIKLPPPPPED
jgi:uncharacterized damage-inducible protein DinB